MASGSDRQAALTYWRSKMRNKSILGLVALVLLITVAVYAQSTGYMHYKVSVVNERGVSVTDALTVVVYAPSGTSAKTVYSDEVKTAIGAQLTAFTSGVAEFWTDAPSVDIKISDGTRQVRVNGITTMTGNVEFAARAAVPTVPMNFSGVVPGTETTGSLVTTGSTWLAHSAAGSCAGKLLCASTATTGDFATWRMRGRSDAAVANTWGVAAVTGINSSASAGHADYANLIGVAGLAQANAYTQANSTNVLCGVYSCMDRTGTSAGHAWSMWIDDHSTTAKAADHYLLRMSQHALGGTPVNIDGAITVQCTRLPVLFNFETADGFLTDSSRTLDNQAGAIAVSTPAGTRYIALYDH